MKKAGKGQCGVSYPHIHRSDIRKFFERSDDVKLYMANPTVPFSAVIAATGAEKIDPNLQNKDR
jgi:hypothetical protein